MTLDAPLLLVAGLLVAAVLLAAEVTVRRRRAAALAAAGAASVTAATAGRAGTWLAIGGIALLGAAAAGPSLTLPVPRAAGTVVVVVDVSASMGADDVEPDRLEAARAAALSFISAQPDSVDIGVVAFEQSALVMAVPSADHASALAAVDRLQLAGGTSLAEAVRLSLSAIVGHRVGEDTDAEELGYWGSATIVLFSDGGGGWDEALEQAASLAQGAGVRIQTVGVGTAEGTSVDADGYLVHTALDEETLTQLAEATGGEYRAAPDAAGLDDIAATIDLRLSVADELVPVAGAVTALALALLVAGAALTAWRTGRIA